MAIDRPYRRNCRQFTDGSYSRSGKWMYMLHPKFAKDPEQFIRAFFLLQKDMHELFDYVEPSEKNLACHSYRIHGILLRACIEVEANCKAILFENGYSKDDNLSMEDYKKINASHRLSSYRVKVPVWHGTGNLRKPFEAWSSNGSLPWYNAYNQTKHSRHEKFAMATFEHMLDAVCGVLAILSSQFHTNDFSPSDNLLALENPDDEFESGIGDYFRVQFPNDWPDEEKYSFDWEALKDEDDPFQEINFD